MAHKTMDLKLLIDRKANRVLFAEAGKEVVDFLFGLLALPLGSIVKLLGQDHMVGSIGCIYNSLKTLDSSYMQPNQKKDILLNPNLQNQCQNNLVLLQSPAPPPKVEVEAYYGCDYNSSCSKYVSKVCGVKCPSCRGKMEKVLQCVHPEPGMASGNGEGEEGYVKDVVTYTIMDDLSVMPTSGISTITLLNKLDIKNVNMLKEETIILRIDDVVFQLICRMMILYMLQFLYCVFSCFQVWELFRASLESKTVLTDVFMDSEGLKMI